MSNQILFAQLPRTNFLVIKKNKSQLIKLLAVLFRRNGIHVEVAERDADASVTSAAIKRVCNDDVVVRAEDTDILCLLVHHYDAAEHRKLYFSTHQGDFAVHDICNNLDPRQRQLLLFVHSFSGCDTVSSIFGFGKSNLLKKLSQCNEDLKSALNVVLSVRISTDVIIKTGLDVFQFIYGDQNQTLNKLRNRTYTKMAANGKIDPSRMPPAVGAAREHSLKTGS